MNKPFHIFFAIFVFLLIHACHIDRKPKTPAAVALENLDKSNLNEQDRRLTLDTIFNNLTASYCDSLNRSLYFDIADKYREANDMDGFLKATYQVKKLAINNYDSIRLSRAYSYIGDFYENTTKPDSAFANYVNAAKICKAIKDSANIGRTSLYKAGVLFDLGMYTEAETETITALRFLENSKNADPKLIFETHLLEGLCLSELSDYDNALRYFNFALADLDEALENGAPEGRIGLNKAGCFNNIGILYEKQKMYAEAILLYNKALETPLLRKERPEVFAMLLDNISISKMRLNQDMGVFDAHLQAYKIRDSLKNKAGIVASNIAMGEYYLFKNDTTNGLPYIKKALSLAKEIKNSNDIKNTLRILSERDLKNRELFTNRYFQVDDSLRKIDQQTRNKYFRIAYETAKLEEENKELIISINTTTIILIIVLIILVITFTVLKVAAKNKDTLHAKEQKISNETIYNFIMGQQDMKESILNEERNRMGRELHDGVVNGIFTTRFGLISLPTKDEKLKQKLIDELQKTEIEIRRVSHDLNTDFLFEDATVTNIITGLIDNQQIVSKTKFTLEIDKFIEWALVSAEGRVHIYRILQEAAQNVHKYAQAKKCNIVISKNKEFLKLQIWDDGIGFDVQKTSGGIGMKNIQERVAILSGKIKIESKKNHGSKFEIFIPLINNESELGQFMPIKALSEDEYDKEWDREFAEI